MGDMMCLREPNSSMMTVLLFERPIAVVRTTDGAWAIAITRWLLKELPTVEVDVEPHVASGSHRYVARSSNAEEVEAFAQRTLTFEGEAHLAAILL
jgi:hypothetical protein